jgi:hypothetical protein
MDGRDGEPIETFTGGRFYPFDPRPGEVELADIAGALAHTCRFGGHCRRFYSVAEHSLYVAEELAGHGERVQAYGLLHDAGEAYVGDVPRPVKARLADFEGVEERIREAVWDALDLPAPTEAEWEAVMAADDRLLAHEADRLLDDGSWAAAPPGLGYDLDPADRTPPAAAREEFLDRARALLGQ